MDGASATSTRVLHATAAVRPTRLRSEYCAAELFRPWRVRRGWDFEELNALIEQHNAWYPIERDLPLNPRTGDYVRVGGRSYRRPVLGEEWVLEQFPPSAEAA